MVVSKGIWRRNSLPFWRTVVKSPVAVSLPCLPTLFYFRGRIRQTSAKLGRELRENTRQYISNLITLQVQPGMILTSAILESALIFLAWMAPFVVAGTCDMVPGTAALISPVAVLFCP